MADAVVEIDRVKHPRDVFDVVALLCLTVGQLCIFYGPSGCVALYLMLVRGWTIGAAIIPLPFALMLAAEAILNGTGLSLDGSGVHIRRLLGGRRLLARWSEISSIEPVGRLQAWFVATFIPWRMLGIST